MSLEQRQSFGDLYPGNLAVTLRGVQISNRGSVVETNPFKMNLELIKTLCSALSVQSQVFG